MMHFSVETASKEELSNIILQDLIDVKGSSPEGGQSQIPSADRVCP